MYINEDKTLVLKVQMTGCCTEEVSNNLPERSVRLWNEINKPLIDEGLIKPAELYNSKRFGLCWTTPYISPKPLDAREPLGKFNVRPSAPRYVYDALNEIYRRTGRRIADAEIDGNFLTVYDKNNEPRAVCIDVGNAYLDNGSPLSPASRYSRDKIVPMLEDNVQTRIRAYQNYIQNHIRRYGGH